MLIYDILDRVREKPALFMGCKSIRLLRSFLDGAGYALHISGIDDGYDDFSPLPFLLFNDYVAHYYNYFESTSGWMNMILDKNNGDEKVSFDIFYTLLDNFRSINISKIHKCVLTIAHINYHYENEYAPKRGSHNNSNQIEPLFKDPKEIYLIELSNNAGYLCMIEGYNTIFLHSSLFRNRQLSIEYFERNFGCFFHWDLVESIPEKFEWA